jgi:hypothetical protein
MLILLASPKDVAHGRHASQSSSPRVERNASQHNARGSPGNLGHCIYQATVSVRRQELQTLKEDGAANRDCDCMDRPVWIGQ